MSAREAACCSLSFSSCSSQSITRRGVEKKCLRWYVFPFLLIHLRLSSLLFSAVSLSSRLLVHICSFFFFFFFLYLPSLPMCGRTVFSGRHARCRHGFLFELFSLLSSFHILGEKRKVSSREKGRRSDRQKNLPTVEEMVGSLFPRVFLSYRNSLSLFLSFFFLIP